MSMNGMPFTVDFAVHATAGLSVAGHQIVTVNVNCRPAVTLTSPNNAAIFNSTRLTEYDKTSEMFSGDIDEFSGHGDLHDRFASEVAAGHWRVRSLRI